ncbi:hypothetical protein KHP62_03595 [Rhodobacteraceae bacterium NNCM2]|nr:hypothetical protein [Coraliihabitans acroporae]
MRAGYVISGTMHGAAIIVVIFGTNWFRSEDTKPFQVTEVALIDGEIFDAQNSTAPIVPNEGPADLSQPAEGQSTPDVTPAPEEQVDAPVAQQQIQASPTPQQKPRIPTIDLPTPPTVIPSEMPRLSIAEAPSPDILPDQAKEPESPAATEALQPLASQPAPQPAPRALPPPEPEPAVAEEPEPEPEEQEEQPQEVAEEQPEAPLSPAPQEARLPVAKPADKAKAAIAASESRQSVEEVAEAEKPAEEKKATPKPQPEQPKQTAGGSKSVFAQRITRGEKDALQIGIKRHFVYNGSRDRGLVVKIEIQVDKQGKIQGKPKLLSAEGGTKTAQDALFRAGVRALSKAQNAGEFSKLPADKYDAWKLIHVRFTPDAIGFAS